MPFLVQLLEGGSSNGSSQKVCLPWWNTVPYLLRSDGTNNAFFRDRRGSKNSGPPCPLHRLIDIRKKGSRLEIVKAVINIGRIFMTITDKVPRDGLIPLGLRVEYPHCTITFFVKVVVKEVPMNTHQETGRIESVSKRICTSLQKIAQASLNWRLFRRNMSAVLEALPGSIMSTGLNY